MQIVQLSGSPGATRRGIPSLETVTMESEPKQPLRSVSSSASAGQPTVNGKVQREVRQS